MNSGQRTTLDLLLMLAILVLVLARAWNGLWSALFTSHQVESDFGLAKAWQNLIDHLPHLPGSPAEVAQTGARPAPSGTTAAPFGPGVAPYAPGKEFPPVTDLGGVPLH